MTSKFDLFDQDSYVYRQRNQNERNCVIHSANFIFVFSDQMRIELLTMDMKVLYLKLQSEIVQQLIKYQWVSSY